MEQAINDSCAAVARAADDQHDRCSFRACTLPPELRCSARLHSFDMAVGGYFDTRGSDDSTPGERMSMAGFAHGAVAESLRPWRAATRARFFFDLSGNPRRLRESGQPGVHRDRALGNTLGLWTFDFAAAP